MSAAFDRIAARERDAVRAFIPDAQSENDDVARDAGTKEFTLDSLSVALPDRSYVIVRDDEGRALYTSDESFHLKDGALVDRSGRAVQGLSAAGGTTADIRIDPIDATLGLRLGGRLGFGLRRRRGQSSINVSRMRISQALADVRPFFSFEFFPPRNPEGEAQLIETVVALRSLRPSFVSVTYGAGGSTRQRTLDVARRIQKDIGLTVMAHATLAGATRPHLRSLFDEIARSGIENVLALRGDPPRGTTFSRTPGGFDSSTEMIQTLRRDYNFCIGAACYPETHIEAESPESDLLHLTRKVNAGAEFLITQLFFDNDRYFRFVDRARAAGITAPIVPGIMPITNYEQIERFTKMCGAAIPPKLRVELEDRRDDPDAVGDLGVAYATLQCTDLMRRGAPGIHFYTLNKSPATRAIVSSLLAASAWAPTFA